MPDHFLEEMCYFYQNLLCSSLQSESNQQVLSTDSEVSSKEVTEECFFVLNVTPTNFHLISAALWEPDDQQSSRGIFDRLEDWVIPQRDMFCSLNHQFSEQCYWDEKESCEQFVMLFLQTNRLWIQSAVKIPQNTALLLGQQDDPLEWEVDEIADHSQTWKKKECFLIKQYYCKTNHTNPSNYSHFPLKFLIMFLTDKYVRVEY